MSLDPQREILKGLLLLYAQVEVYQNILKLRLPYIKSLKKNKNRSGTSLPTTFYA